MAQTKCPVCGCRQFHVKNPDDAYDIYEFEYLDGEVRFAPDVDQEACPRINDSTPTFCNACKWQDKFKTLK